MSIHLSTSRKLLLLLAGFACMALLLVLELHRVETSDFDLLMTERSADKTVFVQEVIRLSGESLDAYANEYSRWDEMVTFVKAPDSFWARRSIYESMESYRADVAFVFAPGKVPVYASAGPAFRDLLVDEHLKSVLVNSIPNRGFFHFYVATRSGLLELRGAPIQPSDDLPRETEPRGYFVVGRVWRAQYLTGLARVIGAELTLCTTRDSSVCVAGHESLMQPGAYRITIPLTGSRNDLAGTVEVAFNAPTTAALNSQFRTQFVVVLISAVLILITCGVLLRRWVSKPLDQVLSSLVSDDLTAVASLNADRSEFGMIAKRITSSIAEREQLREQEARLAASDKRIRTIVDLTGQVFYDTNTTTGAIELMGPVEDITGYSIDTFPGRTLEGWQVCIHPDDRDRVSRLRDAAIQSNGPLCTEYRIRRRDGAIATVEQSGCIIVEPLTGHSHFLGTIKDVTARKETEDTLREGERFLSSIVENIPTMLFVKDAKELRFLIFNKVGADLLERKVEDFVGKTDYDLFRKEDADFFTTCDKKVLEQRSLQDIPEELISTRNNVERILHTRKIPILDEQGNSKWLLGISEDITERKAIEKKLRDSENKFRTIFDHAPDATLLFDKTIIDCNEKACLLFGFSREELTTKSILDLAPVRQPDGSFSQIAGRERISMALEGNVDAFYWQTNNAAGGTIDTEVTLTSMGIGDQVVLLASIRDISRRRIAEDRIRLLATAVAQSADGLVITDLEGSIEYVNPAFEKMTQYKFEEVRGQNPRVLKSNKQDSAFYRGMWETLLSGRTWQGRFENRRKDGSTYLENATISPVQDSSGRCTHFVAVKRDVSHEVALEGMLVQSQKMEAIGRLAGGVAHDFNNILTAILGYSDVLVRRLKEDARSRSDAEEIRKAAARASALTKQLLAFSRRQTFRKEPINLYDLVIDMSPMLRQLIGESVSLAVESEDPGLRVLADSTHLQQVVLNLAVNAKDAMPDGGTLSIAIREEHLSNRRSIGRFDLPAGGYVVMLVTDTGQGMEESVLRHLFEPFFTTKGIGKGTGLGLATVYGIIEQSSGGIEVTSMPNVGTAFNIYLPKGIPQSDSPFEITGTTGEQTQKVQSEP